MRDEFAAMDALYRINDVLTALMHEFEVSFENEEAEDAVLNELTHDIAKEFRVGPYRVRTGSGEQDEIDGQVGIT